MHQIVYALRKDIKVRNEQVKQSVQEQFAMASPLPRADDRQAWKQPCSDDHLNRLSMLITDWKAIAPHLGLTETDEEDIETNYPRSMQCRRLSMLRTWKLKCGEAATYEKLDHVFQQCSRQDLVDKIGELIVETTTGTISAGEFVVTECMLYCLVGINSRLSLCECGC